MVMLMCLVFLSATFVYDATVIIRMSFSGMFPFATIIHELFAIFFVVVLLLTTRSSAATQQIRSAVRRHVTGTQSDYVLIGVGLERAKYPSQQQSSSEQMSAVLGIVNDLLTNVSDHRAVRSLRSVRGRLVRVMDSPVNTDIEDALMLPSEQVRYLRQSGTLSEEHCTIDPPGLSERNTSGDTTVTDELLATELLEDADIVVRSLRSWSFDAFDAATRLTEHTLFVVVYQCLTQLGVVDYFALQEVPLREFMLAVQAGYRDNPYHNATHAADVVQATFFMLVTGKLDAKLTKMDLLAAIIAAAIHDYYHTGVNNAFLRQAGAALSLRYNDMSVLEAYSCSCAFEMLLARQYDFLQLPAEHKAIFRESVIQLVLATDIARHNDLMEAANTRLDEGAYETGTVSPADRLLMLKMVLKFADVSNIARGTQDYLRWSRRLMVENVRQGIAERALHLPISPYANRNKLDPAQNQYGFVTFVAGPLAKAVIRYAPNTELTALYDQMQRNLATSQDPAITHETVAHIMEETENYSPTELIRQVKTPLERQHSGAPGTPLGTARTPTTSFRGVHRPSGSSGQEIVSPRGGRTGSFSMDRLRDQFKLSLADAGLVDEDGIPPRGQSRQDSPGADPTRRRGRVGSRV